MPNPFLTGNEPGAEAFAATYEITDGLRGDYDRPWMDTVALQLTSYGRPNPSPPSRPAPNLPRQSWDYGYVSDWDGEIAADVPGPETNRFFDPTAALFGNAQGLFAPDYAPQLLEENPALMSTDMQPQFELPPGWQAYIPTS